MKNIKIFVLGPQKVGKTSILHQLLFGIAKGYNQKCMPQCLPTIEDVYFATVDLPVLNPSFDSHFHYQSQSNFNSYDQHIANAAGNPSSNSNSSIIPSTAPVSTQTIVSSNNFGKQQMSLFHPATSVVVPTSKRYGVFNENHLLFFDVAGIKQNIDIELLKNYLALADDFILVYSINDRTTFNLVDTIKKLIDQSKGRRDNPIIVLGNKLDLDAERQVDFDEAHVWAKREHIKLFEVTATERETLNDFIVYLASRYVPPTNQPSSSSAFKLRRSKTVQSSSGPNI